MSANIRVLIVDDNEDNINILKYKFRKCESVRSMEWVFSGEDAISSVKNHPWDYYDVIFLDHRMPGITGREALSRFRKSTNAKVVILSAEPMDFLREEYKDSGHSLIMNKPIDLNRLKDFMASA